MAGKVTGKFTKNGTPGGQKAANATGPIPQNTALVGFETAKLDI